MEKYGIIIIGTGSGSNYLEQILNDDPGMKIAVIDKDEPGGICLTRGCIPSKMLLYPAELVMGISEAKRFGIGAEVKRIAFRKVMERMRAHVSGSSGIIKNALSNSQNIDYFKDIAEFIAPYTLKVGNEAITSKKIFLCTGSRPAMPPVKGLDKAGYLTSDTLLKMSKLPKSIAIIGGGYIAAEYGHFFSAMGAKVTIVGRNPRFLPNEEPEASELAKEELSGRMRIITNHEVVEVKKSNGKKRLVALDRASGKEATIAADDILVAAGRASNSGILHPEKGGIKTDGNGWILVNEHLETSQPGVWAFGDALGRHQFKHAANYESGIAYRNAFLGRKEKADYHAVPHAIFSYPEIAGVGMKEKEAIEKHGEGNVLIGFQRFKGTAKGMAMDAKGFVKVILEKGTGKILGAHIIGPHASVLIHELIILMNTQEQTAAPMTRGMYVHPALSEAVAMAFGSLMEPARYHDLLEHYRAHRRQGLS